MKRPTILDIARAAGVSKGAVSFALNGRPGVSEQTRARIKAVAEQLGWEADGGARAFSDGRAGAVGLVVDRHPDVLDAEPFFMTLIAGIQRELGTGPASLLLRVAPDRANEPAIYRQWYAERRVDGVLLVDLLTGDPRPDVLAELGLPAVVLGGPLGRPELPSVWIDDSAVIGAVLEHFAALGHRRVLRVAGPERFAHTQVRSAAFAEAAARAGIRAARIVHADYTDVGGATMARRALTWRRPPTAMLFDNDVMAVAALDAARALGVSVPAELSVVAWDDSMLCRLARPALTAVRRPIGEYGALAVSVLRRLIDGREVAADTRTSAAVQLVHRASTAPPR
ncbi:LacI family transcriptional regulator [Amycolatopsis balhimycina DSM 5908]|uniref:LacI family transcriptional regulator n=1 Tax=Amycolatopsis balhimycina DSM 5908 TaxID=1081091 RepID=A0A428WMD7_AMYBA|nr:LacI family DNA-binding transcriptional regulator [Amycolatopsis balhimycina]RSM44170.1 LacI family transcriptional regulator [Amycolatopsis balhimycina DSM 5908]